MNNVNITGRWVSEPKTSDAGGTKKVECRIAHNHAKDTSYFFNVVFWGKAADLAEQYIKKGGAASVTGRLTQDTWEKEGEKREKVYVTAERFDFAVSDRNEGGAPASTSDSKPSAKPAGKSAATQEEDDMF